MRAWFRHIPNALSAARILLAVPIALCLVHHRPLATLWLFGAAAASDALDGWLARRCGWQSDLGGLLDPLADKLLLATVFVTLAVIGRVSPWIAAAVIVRDLTIVAGALAYRRLAGRVTARPTAVSKLNTLCQVGFILAVIGADAFGLPRAWVAAGGALVLATVAVSGVDYVIVYAGRALRETHPSPRSVRGGGSNPA